VERLKLLEVGRVAGHLALTGAGERLREEEDDHVLLALEARQSHLAAGGRGGGEIRRRLANFGGHAEPLVAISARSYHIDRILCRRRDGQDREKSLVDRGRLEAVGEAAQHIVRDDL